MRHPIMINFDDIIGENAQEHNPYKRQIPDDPYRILIVSGSGSRIRYPI